MADTLPVHVTVVIPTRNEEAAIVDTIRSIPNANPPCGGAPMSNASIKKPTTDLIYNLFYYSIINGLVNLVLGRFK